MYEHRFEVKNMKMQKGYNLIDLLGPKRALIISNTNRETPEITLQALNYYDHKTTEWKLTLGGEHTKGRLR